MGIIINKKNGTEVCQLCGREKPIFESCICELNSKYIKEVLCTFGDNESANFYIKQGLKRGRLDILRKLREDFDSTDNLNLDDWISMMEKQVRK